VSCTRIRAYEPADAAAMVEAVNESVSEVQVWLPWCHPDYTLEEADAWIASTARERAARTAYEFIVVDDGGRFLGACGLNTVDRLHRRANLGYWLRSSATGAGVMTAAVRELAAWAFDHTDLERLEILVATGNARSRRVAERAGATCEGVLRARLLIHGVHHDAVVYSIVRADLAAPR
jgi:ribosomal-protein-serine acetyltransferase